MNSAYYGILKIFSVIASLISPLVTILIGVLLTRVDDILYTLNPRREHVSTDFRSQKTIKLVKIIGTLMIIVGALRLLDNIFDFFRYVVSMFGVMF